MTTQNIQPVLDRKLCYYEADVRTCAPFQCLEQARHDLLKRDVPWSETEAIKVPEPQIIHKVTIQTKLVTMVLFSDEMCLLSGPSSGGSIPLAGHAQTATPRCIYPLTKSQEGMWVEFQTDPTSTKYNLTLEWDLKRLKDEGKAPEVVDVLTAINKITQRYAALRSTVSMVEGKAHLQEFASQDVDPEIRVVHRLDSAVPEPAVKRILRKPFQLQQEPAARWVVLKDLQVFRVYIVGHHIVIDGQSMSLISREFLELLENPEVELQPLAEFSQMHMLEKAWIGSQTYINNRDILVSQVRTKNNASWPKQPGASGRAGQDYRKIDSWATFQKSELDEWSQLFKTSWFRVATALVGLLVVDKTRPPIGKDEVLSVGFGSRPNEMVSCVGQFANALPVRVPLWQCLDPSTSDRSFKSLVSALGKNISTVKKSEMFPAVEVVRTCRSLNIDYQPPKVAVTYSPKLARSECRLFPVEGSWDLFFCFLEYEEDVKLGVIYNPNVFADATIQAMSKQFQSLISISKVDQVKLDDMLDWVPRHPSLPVSLGPGNDQSLKHIHQWFDAQAISSPSIIALSSSELGISLTYGELYSSTEKKAQALVHSGIGREDRVLLSVRRGFAVIEWILAVLKSGAAFVYLDPDFSEAQKMSIKANCEPSMVVDDESMADIMEKFAGSDVSKADMEEAVVMAKSATADSDLAYMIYTSGSTGEPKGVMIEHGNISAFVKSATEVYECGFGARILQLASFSFDASILEWTTALCTGSTLCFAQFPKQLVGEYLGDVVQENEVSFMQITPTALETLPLSRELPSLRQISVGGEAPSREIFSRWHSRVNLVNAYGPTEAAIAVSFNKIDRADTLPEILSAGPRTSQTDIFICSEDFACVLRSSYQGEICLAGPQISRGYRGKPDVTARNFATHANGVRMYRTGDRGALTEDGSLLILGRIDRELKIRGFRIAPEEIEKAIFDANVGVTETSVQTSEDGLDMLAFVAPATIDSRSLASALKKLLPSYKVPSRFVAVEDLPKSVSGKTDHKAVGTMRRDLVGADDQDLQQSDSASEAESTHSIESSQDDEKRVAQIWEDVLMVSSPPPADVNFFDIGGHSLLVPKLHDKLKGAFPRKAVRLVELFHQSTIRQQTALFGGGEPRKITGHRRKGKTHSRHSSRALSKSSSASTLRSVRSSRDGTLTPASSLGSEIAERPAVSITGVSGRFPGAKSADEFYEQLIKGYSGISDTKVEKKTLAGNMWVQRAGSLQDVEDFDHKFWNLSEEVATEMDPQQRLFLEVAYEAITDAGLDVHSMDGGRTGLFVGAASNSYHLHTESVVSDPFLKENRGSVAPSISARTAYHLNISGPNVTVQTNCASSTVALSLAFDAIRLGRCDTAVVGGVSIQLYDGGYVTQKGQIFSSRGECNPFDSRADGTVPADAVTAVVLKRSSDSDSTPVYASLLGTGIGSDGALEKAGYQVPSPRGQAEVIKSAWKVAGMTPEKLKYVEIHGSGTPIGDALELEGLSLAVKEAGGASAPFTVGSTKGNIGNAQHASGLVSLIKICKSMQMGLIPATKGIAQANDMISRSLPLNLARHDTPLEQDDIVAVSASGWGGVNSHLIMGYPDAAVRKRNTIAIAAGAFSRQTLAAPRLNGSNLTEEKQPDSLVVSAFVRHAAEILETDVEPGSNLKELGLTSMSYVALAKATAMELSALPISVSGLTLPACTPLALAQMHEEVNDATNATRVNDICSQELMA